MKKLTKREKALLYILSLVVVVAGMVYFAILPQANLRDTLDTAVGERELALASMQNALSARAAVEADIAEAQARIEERKGKYLPAMTSDDLDRYITGLLQENGLVAEALSFTESGYTQTAASIGAVRVSVAASGALEQIISLMQRTSDIDGVRVSDFTIRFGGYHEVLDEAATALARAEAEAKAAENASNKKKKTEQSAAPIEITRQVPYYTASMGFELLCYEQALAPGEAE